MAFISGKSTPLTERVKQSQPSVLLVLEGASDSYSAQSSGQLAPTSQLQLPGVRNEI